MSAYNYITVGNNWVDVYSTIQVVSGEKSLRITNSSGYSLVLSTSSVEPTENTPVRFVGKLETVVVPNFVDGLWLKSTGYSSTVYISDSGSIVTGDDIPRDLFTTTIGGVRRIATESDSTCFHANTQFKYIDEFDSVPYTSDIVYLVTITKNINVFQRIISLTQGGRKYYLYPYTSINEINGSSILPQNLQRSPSVTNRVLRKGLESVPDESDSGVTLTRYQGTGIFTKDESTTFGDIDQAVSSGTNSNNSTGALSSGGLKNGFSSGGVEEPTRIWLYLPAIGANTETEGLIRFAWDVLD